MTTTGVALVAGASRGLGLLIARELGRRGYRPVLWARDEDELTWAVETLAGEGVAADAVVCDVRDHERVEQLVAEIERETGPIDVAIHVAGIIQVGPLDALTRSHFEEAVEVMQWGPINVALAVLPGMRRRRRGRIGVVSSVGGLVSVPHLLPYSTAKFGAVGFTRGLTAELAGTGVTATTVVPGLMRTGSHLRATFTGDQPAEYAWFAPGASLPLLSMDAETAARRIVQGVLRGRSIVILTPLAKIGVRLNGLMPTTTSVVMKLVSTALPSTPVRDAGGAAGPGAVEGHQARARLRSGVVERLSTLGNRAARRYQPSQR